jgi:hypothetical protein
MIDCMNANEKTRVDEKPVSMDENWGNAKIWVSWFAKMLMGTRNLFRGWKNCNESKGADWLHRNWMINKLS